MNLSCVECEFRAGPDMATGEARTAMKKAVTMEDFLLKVFVVGRLSGERLNIIDIG